MAAAIPPPVAYRPDTQAARVRDWVAAMPAWSIFKLSDVPGPRQVVAKTLSQMASRDPRVERVAKGIYIRVENPFRKGALAYSRPKAAMSVAGAGSGYGALSAVNALGWNWQTPINYHICVVGRAPRAQVQFCKFLSRSNEARRELTWAEVTVLEAVRYSAYTGWDWDTCIEMVADGTSVTRLGPRALIRRDAVIAVGQRERGVSKRFRRQLASLTYALPATVSYPDDGPPPAP